MIELGKTYKDGLGRDVRIICVDRNYGQPVVGLVTMDQEDWIACYTAEGMYFPAKPSADDLILSEDFCTFAIDEPVMVRDSDDERWQRGYFAGVNSDGIPRAYQDRATKWSSKGAYILWLQCRRPTKEELEL